MMQDGYATYDPIQNRLEVVRPRETGKHYIPSMNLNPKSDCSVEIQNRSKGRFFYGLVSDITITQQQVDTHLLTPQYTAASSEGCCAVQVLEHHEGSRQHC